MPWKQEGETGGLTMSFEDWLRMSFMLGLALGAMAPGALAGSCIDLVNRINEGNPDFTPYEPEEPPDPDRDLVTGHGAEYDGLINMRRPLTEAEIGRLLGLARKGE